MNCRALLRSPRGAQAGTLTLPCYEQQNTAEKTNRHKSVLSRCHVMNSRSLLRRPTGPQAGILRCHVMNSRALLRKTQEVPKTPGAFLVHFWCTLGALLVHFSLLVHWCTGALLVHSRCTFGALLVHSRCTLQPFPKGFPKGNCFASERKPRSSAQKRLDRLFANLQTRKGIAPLPKGSLDPLHRNVWIFANLQTRKGIAPLPKGSLDPPHRNVWIALCKGTGK